MAKIVGSTKTGGRKKGTPNKRSLAFVEILESRGIDLLEEILKESEHLTNYEKVGVFSSLLPYVYPKRKPVETPFQFSEHLSLLSNEELSQLHREVTSKLGLLPQSYLTQAELDEKIRQAIKDVSEDI